MRGGAAAEHYDLLVLDGGAGVVVPGFGDVAFYLWVDPVVKGGGYH